MSNPNYSQAPSTGAENQTINKKTNPNAYNLLGLDSSGSKFYVTTELIESKVLEIAKKRLGDIVAIDTLIDYVEVGGRKKDDEDGTEYDKESKSSQTKKIKSSFIVVYFDERNPNFSQRTELFGNVDCRSDAMKKFISDFCATDREMDGINEGRSFNNGKKTYDASVKKMRLRDNGKRYFAIMCSTFKVMQYFFDQKGTGYKTAFGEQPRECDIVIDHDYVDRDHKKIRGFFVTKQFTSYMSETDLIKHGAFRTRRNDEDDNVFRSSNYNDRDRDRNRDNRNGNFNKDRYNNNRDRNNNNRDNRYDKDKNNGGSDNSKPKSF